MLKVLDSLLAPRTCWHVASLSNCVGKTGPFRRLNLVLSRNTTFKWRGKTTDHRPLILSLILRQHVAVAVFETLNTVGDQAKAYLWSAEKLRSLLLYYSTLDGLHVSGVSPNRHWLGLA